MKLTITNLSKTYSNGLKALSNINMEISSGMFGLLGPNGAGKSSLMRTIATLQEADSGSILFGDIDVLRQKDEVRKILGYLPQDFGFYPKVSAVDMLNHFAILKGIANPKERKEVCEALLNQTNLFEARKRNIGDFSGGMRQRFGIAQALLGNPKLVIVDEPTAGLDPMERNRFHNLLSEIGSTVIVILSTHIVDDVRNLCSNMVIMNQGSILLSGKPAQTIEDMKGKIWMKLIDKEQLDELKMKHRVISTKVVEGKIQVHIFSDTQPDASFTIVNADLEDVYFATITN
ncbi:MAG: multidrug ABC transporter ATP-binding protein [Bacteroidetes bacterium RIFCSPLOWO2_12_FULL_35_15]|nr:MAG: multidrug ABC transporter ATP-binding protein [Bacteroidetes bacterium RIFCSPLOWO2_12_FULL_35_15]